MTASNPFLSDWVRNACSMEMGLVSVLERQTREVSGDPQLVQGLDHHLRQTRQHVELLKGCLQRMGESVTAIQPSNPIDRMYGQMNSDGVDETLKTELLDFVTENFEAASYKAIGALAQQLGDPETARVCEQILRDEMAIARALDLRLPGSRVETNESVTPGREKAKENINIVREGIDALNAHDLNAFDRYFARDASISVPGMPGLNLKQYHVYLDAYLTGFPDLHFDITRILAIDDSVVAHWTATGTHGGPLRIPMGVIQPTHKQARTVGSNTMDLAGGKIASLDTFFDTGELMQQLGLSPRV